MMTRETLKDFLIQIEEAPSPSNRWKPDLVCEMVDKIYDDFESRTCENCKHSYSSSIVNPTHCSEVTFPYFNEVDAEWEDMSMEITKDFGCNKFERKE